MTHTVRVLVVPPGYDGPGAGDKRIDEVRVDPDVEEAYIIEEEQSEEGRTVVDRALVTDNRKNDVSSAIARYETETAKDTPDPQIQMAALETAVSYMWDVISGEDVGAALLAELEKESDGESTDDTSA